MFGRFSFRQLLFAGFLLITGLLGLASLQTLYALEELTLQNRSGAERALDLSAAAQSLTERSLAMERTARQSVVLSDRVLRQRFDQTVAEAQAILVRLTAQGLPAALIDDWKSHLDVVTRLLTGPADTVLERDREVAQQFRALGFVNATIAERVRQTIAAQNRELLNVLEQRRLRLGQQVSFTIALAVLLALGFGVWLTRPLNRLEKAIIGLGENRLDQTIRIDGPADLQLVGQRLEWLRLRLVELDADKSRFLRHVSHELKTPLAALREGVSLLEDGVAGALSPPQREIAAILRHNTDVLQNQIEDLLRFNAAAFEARRLNREKTDLLRLVEEQVEAQQLQWRARGLTVDIQGGATPVEVDRAKLGMAIANLLSNAIRYSPLQGVLHISTSQAPGLVRMDLQDQGPGVAAGERERIFEPFFRGEVQPLQSLRGSGIGLSIVQEYVAAHGGRVFLMPDSPGAHFRLEIPDGVQL